LAGVDGCGQFVVLTVKVKGKFDANADDELPLKDGDTIKIRYSSGGWMEATKGTTAKGLVQRKPPSNHMHVHL
jgi:hypothetical protein